MIRIDAICLTIELMDMCSDTEPALTRMIATFGAVKPHFAYLFANRRPMRALLHDRVGA
ncbi:hypothetical protein [Pseudomonas sp.]|uniref:hypothetical protein n=1 Tax=Pseudomonas sp. TaxID=306 RepID=UPI00258CB9EA|nr:hypothetical protein [Pseudomonas sp.]